jgi:hypothetical protein
LIPSFSSRVTAAPDVMCRNVGDEAVLLHLKSEVYLGLDAVGTRMWTLLTELPSIQDAYEVLRTEYDVEPEDLRRDLQAFLGKLQENELIEVQPPDASSQAKTE